MQCIDGCDLDAGPRCQRLKLLQDISSVSGILPRNYRITKVSRGSRIGGGAEATVYYAKHEGAAVVVRQFHPPPHNDWNGDGGKTVLKVGGIYIYILLLGVRDAYSCSGISFQLIRRQVVTHWQLRHRNIVALHGIYHYKGEAQGSPSMVLQHAEYASARNYLRAHPGPQPFLKLVSFSSLYDVF